MKSEIEMPAAPRLWQNLAIVILALSILRGIRYPNTWSYTHFLFNYNQGFVKRGLVGEIMSHVGPRFFLTYEFFVFFSLILLIVNFFLLGVLINDMVSSRHPILIGSGLLFASSLAVVFLAHTIGYLEHIGLFITLIALKIRSFPKKLIFLFLAFPIALFVHEGILILLFPINFMALLCYKGTAWGKKAAWLGAFSLLILVLTFTISEYTLEEAEAEQLYTSLQSNLDFPLRRDAFNVLHRDSQENFQRAMQRWSAERFQELRQSILVTAPTIILLFYITQMVLKHAAAPAYVRIMAVLAALSPLVMYGWGWDMHRWNTFAITTSFLMLYVLSNVYNMPTKVSAVIYFLLGFLVVLNGMSTITLFDNYYVKQFPFMEHQNYLWDLIRGVATFPNAPPS